MKDKYWNFGDKTNISGYEKKISTGTEGDVCINNVFCYNEDGIKGKNTLSFGRLVKIAVPAEEVVEDAQCWFQVTVDYVYTKEEIADYIILMCNNINMTLRQWSKRLTVFWLLIYKYSN